MHIRVVSYDADWPRQARAAIAELNTALPGLFRDIEHMGSTAVPDLPAKPIIDLMASVRDLDAAISREHTLAALGYFREDNGMSNRLFYPRTGASGQRTHHLHVVRAEDWDDQNERILRDFLRTHPGAAADYAALKQQLAVELSDPLEYTRRKTDLIQQLVDQARTDLGLPLVDVWEE
ncbi:GrpB family protein [Nocardia mexicana]|uniref:GrpB family protein n=1 Tax=Nocardia mexicana TaxID=279262 RepID=UPI001B878E30|nr:GrpB family protein [Nocardia mexicana]